MPITVPGKRSSTAAAITWAVEWRRVSRSSLMLHPSRGGADYTERVRTERTWLDGSESLQTGRDVFPAEGSVIERRLDVPVDLKHERELVRQGNDGRAPGLTSKALFAARVHGAAPDTAVLGRCLLDGGVTSRTCADLERGGLLETVSDHQTYLHLLLRSLPRPVSPDALLIMRALCYVSSIDRAFPHQDARERNSWGKGRPPINGR